jgi:sporulation integral membrane protein YtvI
MIYEKRFIKNCIVSLVCCFGVIFIFFKYLLPFTIAILFAMFLQPIVDFFEKKMGLRRWMASILSILISFSFILLIFILVSNHLISDILIITKSNEFGNLLEDVYDVFTGIKNKFNLFFVKEEIINLDNTIENLNKFIIEQLMIVKDVIVNFLTSIPQFIISSIICLLSTYFLLRDRDKIIRFTERLIPKGIKDSAFLTVRKIINLILILIKTEVSLILIFTLLNMLGFWLLQVRYWVLLGVICGILDLLPIVGPGLIFIPWITYSFAFGDNLVFSLALLCLFVLLIVLRQILEAKLMSKNLGLHPIIFLAAIYIGLRFLGIIGIIILPLMVIVAKEIIIINIKN